MALDDLPGMEIPDNPGGRPRNNEDVSNDPINSFPYTRLKDPHEQLQNLVEHEIFGDVEDHIDTLSEHLAVNPIQIRIWLEEIDVFETDWEEFIAANPPYENDSRVPINDGPSTSAGMPDNWKTMGDEKTFTDTDDDSQMDSGLGAMLDKEK